MVIARPRRVLIAGCGDLGNALAPLLDADEVYGLRRQTGALAAGIRPIAADLLTGAGFEQLPAGIDTLVYMPTPALRSEAGYRAIYVDALGRLLAALRQPAPPRVIFVSSTAVYGQDAGECVDESSETAPTAFNGRVLLEAEALALTQVADGVSVRLAGLYGPGRHWLLRRAQAGAAIAAGTHWTNRIHLRDAATLIATLIVCAQLPARVIGVDDAPVPEGVVLDWLAGQLQLPPLPRMGDPDQCSGKRLCNHLARSLGWKPLYSTYQSGYSDVLTAAHRDLHAP